VPAGRGVGACVFADPTGTHTGLESVTQGLARATSHRVLTPAAGASPRYSIPFFQNIAQDLRLSEQVLECVSRLRKSMAAVFLSHLLLVPPEVLGLKAQRGELEETDCAFTLTAVSMC